MIIWQKDIASECLLPSFMLQLQSPEKPEFILCHCDGSQHRFCQPAVPDLGGEPFGLHGEGGKGREEEGGQIELNGTGPARSLRLQCTD